jgi:hypothetical protein
MTRRDIRQSDFRQQATRLRANLAAKLDLMRRDQFRESDP